MTEPDWAAKAAELLPCPFCGAGAYLIPATLREKLGALVECGTEDCACVAGKTDEAAVARWNRRSTVYAQALAGQDEAVAAARVQGIKEGLERAAAWHDAEYNRCIQKADIFDRAAGLNGDGWRELAKEHSISAAAIRALASTLQTTEEPKS